MGELHTVTDDEPPATARQEGTAQMVDAPTLTELQAEIARLRAVCEEFDVDPDWAPKPPLYWVVTEREKADHDAMVAAGRLVSATIDVKLPGLIENLTRNNALLRRLQHG